MDEDRRPTKMRKFLPRSRRNGGNRVMDLGHLRSRNNHRNEWCRVAAVGRPTGSVAMAVSSHAKHRPAWICPPMQEVVRIANNPRRNVHRAVESLRRRTSTVKGLLLSHLLRDRKRRLKPIWVVGKDPVRCVHHNSSGERMYVCACVPQVVLGVDSYGSHL